MRDLPRTHLVLYALAAAGIAVLGFRVLAHDGRASVGRGGASAVGAVRAGGGAGGVGGGAAASVSVGPAGPASVVVHVAGAVRRPGVYRLAPGRRVQDAVRRAGGRARDADLDAINLAARLVDGEQVVVPVRGVVGATGASGPAAAGAADGASGPPAAPVSLNGANAEQLQTLDGVGPATAQKIIAWRQAHGGFRSVDDLGQVPGIGDKRLAALRPHVQP